MNQGRHVVAWWLRLGALALALGGLAFLRARPLPPDPVEELRKALRNPVKDQAEIVAKRVQTLRTIGDLCRALQLREWSELSGGERRADRPNPRNQSRNQSLRKIFALRKKIGDRFLDAVAAVIKDGEAIKRLAVARLLGDLQATGLEDSMADVLVQLLDDKDPPVRAAAAGALGKANVKPAFALKALRKVLQKDEEVVPRRGAAEGLLQLVRAANQPQRAADREETRGGALTACTEAVPVAGVGLKDRDPQVRRLCAEAIQKAAATLTTVLSEALSREEKLVSNSLIMALQKQIEALAQAAADKDPAVVLSACAALEAIGTIRKHLWYLTALAAESEDKDAANQPASDPLGEALQKYAVPVLARQLSHKQVRFRLAALYILETLEARATAAAAAVVKALQDENLFVRWGAARVLTRLAPAQAGQAVPELVKLLEDKNKDVRLAAALALERYGPAARTAVNVVGAVVRSGDAETRLAAIRVLVAVGTEARSAVPALAAALTAPQAEVRQAAAVALARFGPAKGPIVEALRKVLDDPDAKVRQAACAALLVDR